MDTDISRDMFQKPQYLQNFLQQNHCSNLDYYVENRFIHVVYSTRNTVDLVFVLLRENGTLESTNKQHKYTCKTIKNMTRIEILASCHI